MSALWADSAPERRTGRGLPGARGAARARPRVALVCAPRGPPRRIARRVCPHPPWCAGLLRGPLVPRCRALGRWGPAPLRFLRTAPRLPCVARGGARAACGPGLGAARPLRRGRAAPPLAGPPARSAFRRAPCSVALLLSARAGGSPALRPRVLPLPGAPGAARGLPSRACSPAPLHPAGARAACGPRFGSLRAPAGVSVLLGLCLCAVRCACRWVVPHGGPPWAARAALTGGNPIQKVLSVGARSERGKFAQGKLFPRLGAGSVRLQLRYRKGNSLPQIGQYHQYSLTGYPQKGQRGPSGACTMTTSFQSVLLDFTIDFSIRLW